MKKTEKRKKSRVFLVTIAAFLCLVSIPDFTHAQDGNWHERVRSDAASAERPWMGIAILDLTPDVARSLKTDVTEGLLVSDVNNGGPAHSAGVDIGDVILKLDGVEIMDAGDFISRIRGLSAGATVNLQVSRNGVVEEMDVTLGRVPYLPPVSALPYIPTSSPIISIAGAGAAPMTAQADNDGLPADFPDGSGEDEDTYEQGAAMCAKTGPAALFHKHPAHAGEPFTVDGNMTRGWNYGKIYMMALDGLDLTPEQRAKADGLWPDYLKKTIKSGADIKVAEIELMELTASDPVNLEKARQKVVEISSKVSDLRFYKIKTVEEFKKILTAEQRDRLKGMISKNGSMMAWPGSASRWCDASGRGEASPVDPTDLSDASTDPGVE